MLSLLFLLNDKFVNRIDERFYRSGDDIGVGGKTVVGVALILDLHVHFSRVVATFINGLNQELMDRHVAVADRFLDCLDSRIHRTITGSGLIALHACYADADAGCQYE